jgi:zeaxanthin glucosyltransferase
VTIHLGFFCLPGRSHLYAATALARTLAARGFKATFFCEPECRALVTRCGLPFKALERGNHRSDGSEEASVEKYIGPNTIKLIHSHASLVLESAPGLIGGESIDALVVDQADLAAGTIAEERAIPFLNIAMLPPVYLDDGVPPFLFDWTPRDDERGRRRNRKGNDFLRKAFMPTLTLVNRFRQEHGLVSARCVNDLFSKVAIIAQIPELLDFPRMEAGSHIIYTNQFYDSLSRPNIEFPWAQLDERKRPIVYASMGTVRTASAKVYETIAHACAHFDIQLVISLGGMGTLPETLGKLPGDPIVVHYAPQAEILRKAALCITHAGMNTVLEAIYSGVPIVALPVTDDQPGVAARIKWHNIGVSLPFRKLSVDNLKRLIAKVLSDPSYNENVRAIKKNVEKIDGLEMAADTVQHSLRECSD